MAHHVRIGKINDNHIIFAGTDGLAEPVADFISAHLGLQVIGSHILGGVHQYPVLALIGFFHTAVEEKGHMGILLCLRDTCLLHAVCGQPLPESIGHCHLVECHFLIGNGGIIVGEAHISHIQSVSPVKALKIVIAESPGNPPGPVRTEVEEDNGIAVLHRCHRLSILHRQGRLHELIRLPSVIGFLDPADAAGCRQSLPLCQGIVGQLHPVPVVVPVHHIVTPHHRSNLPYTDLFHPGSQGLGIFLAAGRRRVTSVQEAVYIHLLKTVSLRQFQQSVQVGVVAVYPAV